MATLVLTAVGTAIGGPIGGAVGAILGQQIDQAVFAPAPRQGPRLGDLAVQTSSYGTQIPKLFGATRVSGTVIWATDLIETRTQTSGGKGRPATDTYSYAASFAVALSGRPIGTIGRIWADGKLIRGAAGDLKVETILRVYRGDEDQPADPLIASAEGAALTPAYRGCAYAVFEAMALSDFGNRIPSLSFEVFADTGAVGTGAVIAALCDGAIDAEAGPLLGGIAARGDSVRALAETIDAALPMIVGEADGRPVLRFAPEAGEAIAADDLGASAGEDRAPPIRIERQPLDAIPVGLSIAYQDPARDYQAGLQRAWREGGGRRELRTDLPASIAAPVARTFAERALAVRAIERVRATVLLPWRALMLRPGMAVTIEGASWRIIGTQFERMAVRLDLVRSGVGTIAAVTAGAGRSTGGGDLPHGPTTIAVIDLPPLGDIVEAAPRVAVFAAGESPGWRRAALLASSDGGATFEPVGATGLRATMGQTLGPLAPGDASLIDRINTVDVELLNADMMLSDADTPALLGGANRAMIGGELIQFGRAAPVGARTYRLSELWRGRRGTEPSGQAAGTRFVLVEDGAFALLPADRAVAGVIVMAAGIGDAAPYPQDVCAVVGRAVMPLSPIALQADAGADGDVALRWVRRSRAGWAWPDGVDAPLGEERESYRVTKITGGGSVSADIGAAGWVYASADRALDHALGFASVRFEIAQIGTARMSPATAIDVATA